jgi:hypothetical protein
MYNQNKLIMKNIFWIPLTFILISGIVFASCDALSSNSVEEPSGLQILMNIDGNSDSANLNNEITFHEIKFFVEELELEGTKGTRDIEIEDFIVNLPVDGTPTVLFEKEIKSGVYDEFELEIEKPDDDFPIHDFDFRDETGSYSLIVKGTFEGNDFTFRTDEDIEIEKDLKPPFKVNEGENGTFTVSVDVASWFAGPGGEALNPNDYRNTKTIIKNIKKSFDLIYDS